MVLKTKFVTAIFLLLSSLSSFGKSSQNFDRKYLMISKIDVVEVYRGKLDPESLKQLNIDISVISNPLPIGPGEVIKVVKDLVALGEDIYRLVVKGKPTNTTKYAPISVIPKVNGEPIDILETEKWQAPMKRTYEVSFRNMYRMNVVSFRYSVIYAYGGSYNGKGAYLTAVQIVPESVSTMFGFDFTATMKLGGIQNNGTRENPIAGATILMEYTVSNILWAENKVDSFFITGLGGFKKL